VDDRIAEVATGPTGAHEAATRARANTASPARIDRRLGIAPTEDSLGSLMARRGRVRHSRPQGRHDVRVVRGSPGVKARDGALAGSVAVATASRGLYP
jgi:hypothetical protein